MRLRLFQIIQRAQDGDQVSRWYDIFIVVVAFLSIVPLMFKEDEQSAQFLAILNIIDIVTVTILFADYIFRWITHDIRTGNGLKSFIIYPFSPMAIIDLLSILPSITILHNVLKFLRVLRIVKILRMFKGLTIVTNVFIRERRTLISVVFFIFVYIFTVALIMFAVEPQTFDSFADALYWSTTALATIGYGDIYPVTDLGKAIATVSSIVGIAVVAFPAGIVTGGYITQLQRAKEQGRDYFSLPVKHNKSFKGRSITKYKSPKTYFKTHRKVKVYLIVMIICLFISILCNTTALLFIPIGSLGFLGFVLAALLLEPCAGIMVALFYYFLFVCFTGYGGDVLVFGSAAIYIISFGVMYRRGRQIDAKSVFITLFLCVIVGTLYTFFITKIVEPQATNEYIYDANYVSNLAIMLNIDFNASLLLYFTILRFATTVLLFVATILIRNLVWGSKIDPINYFAKTRRYKYRIYKRRKNELSYLQAWAQSNPDENIELSEVSQLVKKGKKSIESSKKSIDSKKKQVIKMQKSIDSELKEIEKLKQEISQQELAVDVKKKVVKKVKKKADKMPDDSVVTIDEIISNKEVAAPAAEFRVDHEALDSSPTSNIPIALNTVPREKESDNFVESKKDSKNKTQKENDKDSNK